MAIKFTRRNKPKAIVDMVPMIDIVFQLVIFFMVATSFKVTTGMELELPNSTSVTDISTTPLKITVKNKDNILIGNVKTNFNNFEKIIKSVAKNKTGKQSVVVYGNKKMEYQLLIDIMDILRLNGYDSVDLALRKLIK